jgi:hypothetical protein
LGILVRALPAILSVDAGIEEFLRAPRASVIAINLDHDRADAEQFLQRFHPDFTMQFDPQGSFAEQFKVAGMPTSVIIDRHGVASFTHIGFRPADRDAYENELRALLAEK